MVIAAYIVGLVTYVTARILARPVCFDTHAIGSRSWGGEIGDSRSKVGITFVYFCHKLSCVRKVTIVVEVNIYKTVLPFPCNLKGWMYRRVCKKCYRLCSGKVLITQRIYIHIEAIYSLITAISLKRHAIDVTVAAGKCLRLGEVNWPTWVFAIHSDCCAADSYVGLQIAEFSGEGDNHVAWYYFTGKAYVCGIYCNIVALDGHCRT